MKKYFIILSAMFFLLLVSVTVRGQDTKQKPETKEAEAKVAPPLPIPAVSSGDKNQFTTTPKLVDPKPIKIEGLKKGPTPVNIDKPKESTQPITNSQGK